MVWITKVNYLTFQTNNFRFILYCSAYPGSGAVNLWTIYDMRSATACSVRYFHNYQIQSISYSSLLNKAYLTKI